MPLQLAAGTERRIYHPRKVPVTTRVEHQIETRVQLFYPFRKMEIGDTFLVVDWTKRKPLSASISAMHRRTAMRFTMRKTNKGIRCWRIA